MAYENISRIPASLKVIISIAAVSASHIDSTQADDSLHEIPDYGKFAGVHNCFPPFSRKVSKVLSAHDPPILFYVAGQGDHYT